MRGNKRYTLRVPPNRQWWLAALICWLSTAGPVDAQILGNPNRNMKSNEWSIGLSAEFLQMDLGTGDDRARFSSFRGLTKVAYGLSDRITTSFLFGRANLRIDNPRGSANGNFDGDYRLAVGYQGTLEVLRRGRWAFFAGGGILKVKSNGSFERRILNQTETVALKFAWNEYSAVQGLRFAHPRFTFYAGVEQLDIRRTERLSREKFKTGFRVNYFGGVDILASRTVVLNFQVKMYNTTTVSIGLSERTIGF